MNTQQKAIFDQMVAKASSLSVEQLKEAILKDSINPELDSVVFDSLLNALEDKVSEAEFIAFCEEIEV